MVAITTATASSSDEAQAESVLELVRRHNGEVVHAVRVEVPAEFYDSVINSVTERLALARLVGMARVEEAVRLVADDLTDHGYTRKQDRRYVETILRQYLERMVETVVLDARDRMDGTSGLRNTLKSLIPLIKGRQEKR